MSSLLDLEQDRVERYLADFADPRQEWRRLASEFVGTFFLVLVAAGAPMVAHAYPGTVPFSAFVIAPGMMVMAMILFMGKVSGAHFNPGVSVAFALRRDFPWRRVPGYVACQLAGSFAAAGVLVFFTGQSASVGGSYPGSSTPALVALFVEALLTFGLVSTILGTASGAQNVGLFGALAVGAYIALAGWWAAPLSGASMNFARTLGPNVVGADLGPVWVYLAGPLLGVLAAVAFSFVLRGPGGGRSGSFAAQGALHTQVADPSKA